MTADLLSAIAGILLSLAFSYLPGISDWFDTLDPTRKRLVMASLLFVASIGTFALSCANLIDSTACTQTGAWSLVSAFVAALVANQSMYLISPRRRK